MKRREVLRNTSIFLGAVSMGLVTTRLTSCKIDKDSSYKPMFLSVDEFNLLDEISETILPKTDTPGAKDAKVSAYLDSYAKLFLEPDEQQEYKNALGMFDATAVKLFEKGFVKLEEANKAKVLQSMIDNPATGDQSPSSVFYSLRDAINKAYFTSELVAAEVLDYDPIPGNYDGDIPLSSTKGLVYSG